MRRIIVFLILSGLAMNGLMAQDLIFGAKAGVNFATLTNNDDYNQKFGMHFGAVAELELSENLYLQPELLYSAQGYKRDFEGRTLRAKIDYLNLPILFSYEVINDVRLMAGPQFAMNIRSELDGEGQEVQNIPVNDLDVSGVFGMQINVDASFFIQGRYQLGLSEVLLNQEEKHSVISLSIGFLFDQ
ncbi:MAG: PorT family protein [Flavobacteriaceae bacterium]|nr:PorT family protein [Flavobacteriaceae bacterium]